MSDAVVVGLIAGSAAILAPTISALILKRGHREHEGVSRETGRVVTEIRFLMNGEREAQRQRIAELEAQLAEREP